MTVSLALWWAALPLLLTVNLAQAHGDEHIDPNMTVDNPITSEETPYGRQGMTRDVARTIEIRLDDSPRFNPDLITVTTGETVRLRLMNTGQQPHEFVLGTPDSLKAHAAMMMQIPDMAHADPNLIRIETGKSSDLIWQFTRAGNFEYACLIPGHWQAGMQGRVTVLPPAPNSLPPL
ncbi:copper binding plastocyanin/azurin family protein [Fluviicoccus keumensis]|uniref:Copper binding plastocyanin/azurin family protein n=1 Tax=Fluviicoccus keumensis TaxID=1435465 RepID=A0A4Q7ZC04_9GAMM|nr:cupredoxin family protein [Fluviicoccus keumensis]RZU48148.1 copper binding plastocyanin/azurin family protein [Fluviicoccus keumensis]